MPPTRSIFIAQMTGHCLWIIIIMNYAMPVRPAEKSVYETYEQQRATQKKVGAIAVAKANQCAPTHISFKM